MKSASFDLREEARASSPRLPDSASDPALVEHARATWRGRMVNEHGSARVFLALAAQLRHAEMDGAEECEAFAEEERHHGVLCGAVLEALGGDARFEEAPCRFPRHDDAAPREAVVRNVLSIGCLSETVAVALIAAERLAMPEGPLRDLLASILADEIGHARFGWKLVTGTIPAMGAAERENLDRYLCVAFAALERHQLEHISPTSSPGERAAELGVCDGNDMRALFYATVSDVIIPRLTALGLAAQAAWDTRNDRRS